MRCRRQQIGAMLLSGLTCLSASLSDAAEPNAFTSSRPYSSPAQRQPARLLQTIEPIEDGAAPSPSPIVKVSEESSIGREPHDPFAFPQKRVLPLPAPGPIEPASGEQPDPPGEGLKLFRVPLPASLPPLLPARLRSEKGAEAEPTLASPPLPPPAPDDPFVEESPVPELNEPPLLHPDEVFNPSTNGCDALPFNLSGADPMTLDALPADERPVAHETVRAVAHDEPNSTPDPVMLDSVRPRTSRASAPKVRAPLLERFFR